MDLARLGLVLDSRPAAQGAAEWKRATDSVRQSSAEAAAGVGKMESAFTTAARQANAAREAIARTTAGVSATLRTATAMMAADAAKAGAAMAAAGRMMGTVLAELAITAAPVALALAGTAALAFVIDKFTGSARKAREEQDRLTGALDEWYKKQQQGPAGALNEQLVAQRAHYKALADNIQKARVNLEAYQNVATRGNGADVATRQAYATGNRGNTAEDIRQRSAALQEETRKITAAYQAIQKAETEFGQKQRSEQTQQLADLITSNNATAAERQRALELLKNYQAQLAYLNKFQPGQTGLRNQLAGDAAKLQGALFPKSDARADAKAMKEAEKAAAEQAKAVKQLADAYEMEYAGLLKTALAIGLTGEQQAGLNMLFDSYTEWLKAEQTLSGPLLAARQQQIRAMVAMKLSILEAQQALEAYQKTLGKIREESGVGQSIKDGIDASRRAAEESIADLARLYDAHGKRRIAEDTKAAKDAAEPLVNALRSAQSTFSEFLANVLRGGISTFQQLANAIRDIFARMVAELAAMKIAQKVLSPGMLGALGMPTGGGAGGAAGLMAKIGGYGSVIGASGAVGYGIGSMTSNRGLGALGGAASGAATGALIGSVVPIVGTAIGGLIGGAVGAIGGLLGSGAKRRAEERAAAEKRAQEEIIQGDARVRALAAEGRTYEAESQRLEMQHRAEMRDAEQKHYDLATRAAIAMAQASETAALAADQARRRQQEAYDRIRSEGQLFGESDAQTRARIDALYGFQGLSRDQILAQYTRYTPGQDLSEEQRARNEAITRYYNDFGGARGAGSGSSLTLGTVSSISAAQSDQMVAILTTHSFYLSFLPTISQTLAGGGGLGGLGPIAADPVAIDRALGTSAMNLRAAVGAPRGA